MGELEIRRIVDVFVVCINIRRLVLRLQNGTPGAVRVMGTSSDARQNKHSDKQINHGGNTGARQRVKRDERNVRST